jgi:hypothetical protein
VIPIGVGCRRNKKAGANSHRPSDVAPHTSASTSVVIKQENDFGYREYPLDNHQRCLHDK